MTGSTSLRSGRQHKAWGEAQRNPRNQQLEPIKARGAADSIKPGVKRSEPQD